MDMKFLVFVILQYIYIILIFVAYLWKILQDSWSDNAKFLSTGVLFCIPTVSVWEYLFA